MSKAEIPVDIEAWEKGVSILPDPQLRAFYTMEAIGQETGYACRPRPYVAKLLPGGSREFLRHTADYANANSKGSRGVMWQYLLPPGVYVAREWTAWTNLRTFYILSHKGSWKEITKEDAEQCLQNADLESVFFERQ